MNINSNVQVDEKIKINSLSLNKYINLINKYINLIHYLKDLYHLNSKII